MARPRKKARPRTKKVADASSGVGLASGLAFLAEICADPDDDELRRVYADWLLERGDPRGELISLQLAPHTEVTARREASLLKEHGKRWAGALDRYLAKDGRIWRRGFLAGGTIAFDATRGALPAALSDPAWSTFEELELPWGLAAHRELLALALVELPWVRKLRALRGIHEATAAAVLFGEARPRLREVAITLAGREWGLRDALAGGDSVPNLEHLVINGRSEVLPWLLATPLARRLVRLTGRHHRTDELGRWIAAVTAEVAEHRLPLREIGFDHVPPRTRDTPWRFTVTRDGDRFRRLRAEPVGASTLPDRRDLVAALASLQADGLAELVVPPTRTNRYSADDIAAVEAALARFRDAVVDVPWPRLARSNEATTVLDLGLPKLDVGALWDRAHRMPRPPVFDSYEVDARGHRALPADGRAHVVAQAGKPYHRLRVYESAGACELQIVDGKRARIACHVADEPSAVAAYLAWVAGMLDETAVSSARASYCVEPPQLIVHSVQTRELGWLELLSDGLDASALAAELPWLRTVATRAGALLVIGSSPHRPPTLAQQTELGRALGRATLRAFAARLGYDPREAIATVVTRQLIARGYTLVEHPDPLTLAFVRGRRGVRISFLARNGELVADCRLAWLRVIGWAYSHDEIPFGKQSFDQGPLEDAARWGDELDAFEHWFAAFEEDR